MQSVLQSERIYLWHYFQASNLQTSVTHMITGYFRNCSLCLAKGENVIGSHLLQWIMLIVLVSCAIVHILIVPKTNDASYLSEKNGPVSHAFTHALTLL